MIVGDDKKRPQSIDDRGYKPDHSSTKVLHPIPTLFSANPRRGLVAAARNGGETLNSEFTDQYACECQKEENEKEGAVRSVASMKIHKSFLLFFFSCLSQFDSCSWNPSAISSTTNKS